MSIFKEMHALLLAIALQTPVAVDARTRAALPSVSVSISPDADPSLVDVTAIGRDDEHADFHGVFPANEIPNVIQLSAITADEAHALVQVNRFRSRFGMKPLSVDENLTETARYWAREEQRAGQIGHTCAALGNPRDCVEFNTYFHRLPGAPQDQFSGQNAAFDPVPSWSDADALFEAEEHVTSGERGHFLNLVQADAWIGFGEAAASGGQYFAMNLI